MPNSLALLVFGGEGWRRVPLLLIASLLTLLLTFPLPPSSNVRANALPFQIFSPENDMLFATDVERDERVGPNEWVRRGSTQMLHSLSVV
jgi:hypothetical protein